MPHPSLVVDKEDRKLFEQAGFVGSQLIHTIIDALCAEPTMTRRGLTRRLREHSNDLALIAENLEARGEKKE